MFVTHAVDQVLQICDRAVMLEHGEIHSQGDPKDVVREFRLVMSRQDVAYGWDEGTKEIEIVSAEIYDHDGAEPRVLRPR